ncbi:2-nitropropane dioxygenase [Rhodofomes roseus]|uniref:2-nitropropane dioxygenase n=1 Tax=Rhodofomes roseus TaxID=34475 RepID=A0ABQ8KNN8_9APHY|nr:2-nitropropane dioxygenase [Rhodofomes roseus]KAH9839999.1 2-nitropropane dioxygenase [Rhodofomes roseus]
MPVSISTELTKLLNVTSPIISAPMTDATSPALVAAVINAGGFGFLGTGRSSAARVATDIDETRAAVAPAKQHLVGVGLVGWVLDMSEPTYVKTVLEKKVGAVLFAYGRNLGKYVAQVREYDAANEHKTLVFVTVNTVEEATRVAKEFKPDVLVVQGYEAGGRAGVSSPATKDFIQSVAETIPDHPLLVAAGGVTKGSQIAELLKAGASGAIVGTRFLFTPECTLPDEAKQLLIKADAESTVRSPIFDVIFPDGVWPDGIQARCLKTSIVTYDARIEELKAKQTESAKEELEALKGELRTKIQSDKDYPLIYAGLGVTELKEIQPAFDVAQSLHDETVEALRSLDPQLLVGA